MARPRLPAHEPRDHFRTLAADAAGAAAGTAAAPAAETPARSGARAQPESDSGPEGGVARFPAVDARV